MCSWPSYRMPAIGPLIQLEDLPDLGFFGTNLDGDPRRKVVVFRLPLGPFHPGLNQ